MVRWKVSVTSYTLNAFFNLIHTFSDRSDQEFIDSSKHIQNLLTKIAFTDILNDMKVNTYKQKEDDNIPKNHLQWWCVLTTFFQVSSNEKLDRDVIIHYAF